MPFSVVLAGTENPCDYCANQSPLVAHVSPQEEAEQTVSCGGRLHDDGDYDGRSPFSSVNTLRDTPVVVARVREHLLKRGNGEGVRSVRSAVVLLRTGHIFVAVCRSPATFLGECYFFGLLTQRLQKGSV